MCCLTTFRIAKIVQFRWQMKDEHGALLQSYQEVKPYVFGGNSATLSTINPNGLGAREILRCATNRLSQGTTQNFTKMNINYVSINVKYGLRCDTWYAVCTLISIFRRILFTEAASRSASSPEAEVFQQDGVHAFYEEYTAQRLNTTILLYLCGVWGLIIGYLSPLQVTCISKSKGLRLYIV